MKRSAIVSLALVGTVGACAVGEDLFGSEAQIRRNYYADRAACERDYSPAECETSTDTTYRPGYGYVHGWYGPYYTPDRSSVAARSDPGPGRTGVTPTSYETSTRSGFGSIGRTARASS